MIAEQAPICPSCNTNRCQSRGAKKDGRKDYRGRCSSCRKAEPGPAGLPPKPKKVKKSRVNRTELNALDYKGRSVRSILRDMNG